ncbi:MAG: transcription factor S [Ignisphaera sp.]|uniref:Transcription factor S n=1 Tax=Ignisphaera aggregans TaxID=334771 RepID=A0A7C4NPU8_9CREN
MSIMFFCPKCGSVIVAKGGNIVCPKCGTLVQANPALIQYFKKSTHFAKVYEKKVDVKSIDLPTSAILDTNIACPKCGNRGVYYWRRHRSSAESSDVIEKVYKCSSCGYNWSEIG